ncbi:hypothetical protein ACH5RR_032214 [Cinchona calisaya]|uniref:peptidylprolyl isomerase n=1 Tax=Cinchona calisaya TaxID=153742 RepID=A0ABD2YHF7_9GENT
METLAVKTHTDFHFPNFKRQSVNAMSSCQFSKGKCSSITMGWNAQQRVHGRTIIKQPFAIQVVSSGLEDTQASSSQFQEFSVTTRKTDKANELKISIVVAGTKTQADFDNVFSAMVADAQPIPGFRRVKGGKTPNIPKDILLEILGPSNVYKQVIKRIINSTISDYVQKEGLTVGKDLRVEHSFEDLEAIFEPGDQFKFEATLQYCQE